MESWNDVISDNIIGGFCQTTYYADYVKFVIGDESIFYKTSNCQLLYFKRKRFMQPDYYWWVDGPIGTLDVKFKNCKGFFPLFHEPIGNHILKWETFLIDLTKYNILDADKKSVQNNIKRAEKQNVKICKPKDIDDVRTYFQILYKGTRQSRMELDIKKSWEMLQNNLFLLLLAKIDDKIIGGLGFDVWNGVIRERGIARITDYDQCYPTDLLRWSGIKYGTENKLQYYDLAGVNPTPLSEKEKGIFRNKKKWGGKYFDWLYLKID